MDEHREIRWRDVQEMGSNYVNTKDRIRNISKLQIINSGVQKTTRVKDKKKSSGSDRFENREFVLIVRGNI
jgi:hypothetical protein